jgi:hypothetical protein
VAVLARRGVVLPPLVLGRGHGFKVVGVHTRSVPAQVVGVPPSGDFDASEVEKGEVRDPVPLAINHDAVGVAVVGVASSPLPAASLIEPDEPHESLSDAHVGEFTIRGHYA